MEKDGINSFGAYLELITNRNPVVHQITNFVTANDCVGYGGAHRNGRLY